MGGRRLARRGTYCSAEEASFEGDGRRDNDTGEDVIPCNCCVRQFTSTRGKGEGLEALFGTVNGCVTRTCPPSPISGGSC
jgi:hypothetical protein